MSLLCFWFNTVYIYMNIHTCSNTEQMFSFAVSISVSHNFHSQLPVFSDSKCPHVLKFQNVTLAQESKKSCWKNITWTCVSTYIYIQVLNVNFHKQRHIMWPLYIHEVRPHAEHRTCEDQNSILDHRWKPGSIQGCFAEKNAFQCIYKCTYTCPIQSGWME